MTPFKEQRLKCGLRVVEVAKLLDITPSYLWAIEKGCRTPGRDILLELCELYKCEIRILLPKNYTKCCVS